MQAIVTKYLGPTNNRGSRVKATAWAGSITIPYDYSMGRHGEAHAKAAMALVRKLGWNVEGCNEYWVEGGMPWQMGSGSCFVSVPSLVADPASFYNIYHNTYGM